MKRPWYNSDLDHISVSTSLKCGWSTLKEARRPYKLRQSEEPMYLERYFVVRDPIERFKSFYRYLRVGKVTDKLRFMRDWDVDTVLDYITKHWHSDDHWRTQTDTLGDWEVKLIPLDKLSILVPEPPKNVTKGKLEFELSSFQEERLEHLYAEDFDLFDYAVKRNITPPTLSRK